MQIFQVLFVDLLPVFGFFALVLATCALIWNSRLETSIADLRKAVAALEDDGK